MIGVFADLCRQQQMASEVFNSSGSMGTMPKRVIVSTCDGSMLTTNKFTDASRIFLGSGKLIGDLLIDRRLNILGQRRRHWTRVPNRDNIERDGPRPAACSNRDCGRSSAVDEQIPKTGESLILSIRYQLTFI